MTEAGVETLVETRRLLGLRLAGEAAQLAIASIGDSWTRYTPRWSGPAAAALKATYGDAGPGWVGFGFYSPASPDFLNGGVSTAVCAVTFSNIDDWDYSKYNGATSPDISSISTATVGTQVNVAAGPAGCSTVKLFAFGTADGAVRYRFNAGNWVALSLVGSGLMILSLSGVPAGAWTLDIDTVAGTVTLAGLNVESPASGIRWHKIAGSGSSAATWVTRSASGEWATGLAALAPQLVMILHGTNDQSSSSTATFKANVQTLVTRIRAAIPGCDVLLIAPCENMRGLTPTMADYAAALYELAVANGCAFLDLQPFFGVRPELYAYGSGNPLFDADGVHPATVAGGRVITTAVLGLLQATLRRSYASSRRRRQGEKR